MARRAIIIGGGQIGCGLARVFENAGWDSQVVSRSTPVLPVTGHIVADRTDFKAFQSAIGDGADVLIDTIAFDAPDAIQLLAFEDRVDMFIGVSSASVYCDDGGRTLDEAAQNGFPALPEKVTEEQSTVAAGPETYSTRKIAMEESLLASNHTKTAIIRPCAIYGSGCRHPREWWFVKRLLDGRGKIPLLHGSSRFQTSAVENIAGLILQLAENETGGVFNAPDPDSPSVQEIGQVIVDQMGKDVEFIDVDAALTSTVGRTPWSIPKHFTISDAKARCIGYQPAGKYAGLTGPYLDWLAAQSTAKWEDQFPQLAAYPFDLFDYQAEDQYFSDRATEEI